jgi:hypothetical protein
MKEWLKLFIYSKYFVIIMAIVIGVLSAYFWYPDNPIEEIAEEIIKEETGIDIDLTLKSNK